VVLLKPAQLSGIRVWCRYSSERDRAVAVPPVQRVSLSTNRVSRQTLAGASDAVIHADSCRMI
jgi:hypothetical protein